MKTLSAGLRSELKKMLDGGQAHARFEDAVKGLRVELRGVVPEGLPYSAWQILEHMRIAQEDIVAFCDNEDGTYKAKKWPDSYWPDSAEPPSAEAWDVAVANVKKDRAAFEGLIRAADDEGLVTPFAWGDGQSLLREAFLIAAHESYHTGELIVVRRLLGAWKK